MTLSGCFRVHRRSPLSWVRSSCAVDEMASALEVASEGLLLVVRGRDDVDLQLQLQARLTLQITNSNRAKRNRLVLNT